MKSAKFRAKRERSVSPWHRTEPRAKAVKKTKKSVMTEQRGGGCRGKRRFPDLMSVLAGGLYAAEMLGSKDVYAYKCRYCRGYHLTKEMFGPHGEENRWVFSYGREERNDHEDQVF